MFDSEPFKEESGGNALRLDERLPSDRSIYRSEIQLVTCGQSGRFGGAVSYLGRVVIIWRGGGAKP
jgi:hypothetical protein